MWKDFNVEMWLELVGVDREDQPKMIRASGLKATLTRFSGQMFNNDFCQTIIDMMGGTLEIPQLSCLCRFISQKSKIFNSLSKSNHLEMPDLLIGLRFQGYYSRQEDSKNNGTNAFISYSLLESSAWEIINSTPKLKKSEYTSNYAFTLEDFILISVILEFFTSVGDQRERKNHQSTNKIKQLFPNIDKWVQVELEINRQALRVEKTRRVAVVTGSNRGLGFGIVRKLCQDFDGDVYLTSRDKKSGLEAVEKLNTEGLYPNFHILDITSDESIKNFKSHLIKVYSGLDILINNAATAFLHTGVLEEDIKTAEATIGCNYFGTLKLCTVLFPILRQDARVVNIVSSCGVFAITGNEAKSQIRREKLSSSDLNISELNEVMNDYLSSVRSNSIHEQGWQDVIVSSNNISKIGLQALTSIQQKEQDSKRNDCDIVINSFHPGLIRTEKAASFKGPLVSVDEAAIGVVKVATLPPGKDIPKGQFLWKDLQVVDWRNGPIPWCY